MKAINLGLSVMWGDRNLGATSPEGSGRIYTWTEATKLKNGLDLAYGRSRLPSDEQQVRRVLRSLHRSPRRIRNPSYQDLRWSRNYEALYDARTAQTTSDADQRRLQTPHPHLPPHKPSPQCSEA